MYDYAELKKIKKECLEYAEKNFRGKSFKNLSTNAEIEVSKKGLNEWYSKSKSLEQILSIKKLDEILTNAIYSHCSTNTKNKEVNAPTYEYYKYSINIFEKRYCAIISVRIIKDGKSDRHIYYHHYLDDIYIKNEPPSSIPRNPIRSNELLLDGSTGDSNTFL